MNEDYVSLEIARLLKEQGFNLCVHQYYNRFGNFVRHYMYGNFNALGPDILCSAPDLYTTQKWLREVKGIYIWVEPVVGHKWTTSYCDLNVSAEESDWINQKLHKDGYPVYDTYEEALNAGILEALKLI